MKWSCVSAYGVDKTRPCHVENDEPNLAKNKRAKLLYFQLESICAYLIQLFFNIRIMFGLVNMYMPYTVGVVLMRPFLSYRIALYL